MNSDFRIKVSAVTNYKILKLMKCCGDIAFYNLVALWTFTALNKPTGVLTDMNSDDIELASSWRGEAGSFYNALVNLKLIDIDNNSIASIHDWKEHNGYAYFAEARSAKARKAACARWGNAQMPNFAQSNAPAPDPSPDPSPAPAPAPDPGPGPALEPTPAPEPYPVPVPSPAGTHNLMQLHNAGTSRTDDIVISILLNDETEHHVTKTDVKKWQEAYPAIDVLQNLRSIKAWGEANPTKRKSNTEIRRHINGWLCNAQNKAETVQKTESTNSIQNIQPTKISANQAYMLGVANYLTQHR